MLDRVRVRAVGGCGHRPAGAIDLVRCQIVEHDDEIGCGRRCEDLVDIGPKAVPVIGPSSTSGTTVPLCRRPAMNVVVRQWLYGTVATKRWSVAQRGSSGASSTVAWRRVVDGRKRSRCPGGGGALHGSRPAECQASLRPDDAGPFMRLEDRTAIAAVAFGRGIPVAHPQHQLDWQ